MTSRSSLAGRIDHTLLTPEATGEQVAALVVEAEELGVFAVCLSPSRLPLRVLRGVQVCTVIGFPSGAHASEIKAAETRRAVRDGAQEVDMVVDLGRVKAGDFEAVEADVAAVVAASGPDTLVKVIVESAALTRAELVEACRASERGGAQYVKTSTGFHPAGGASEEAVRVMAETVDGRLGVKASGGIRDTATARAMLDAGATRLGLSGSRAVLDGLGPDT